MAAETKQKFDLKFTMESSDGKTTAIIVAAGSASRMGGTDKIMLPLKNIPTIIRSALAFQNSECIDNIILVLRTDLINTVQNLLSKYGLSKVTDLIEGGRTRAESVARGVAACGMETDILLIHDGARPLVTPDIILSVKEAAEFYGGAAPAVPLKDTVKIVDTTGKIIETPTRNSLVAIQTPQGFKMADYISALSANTDSEITDDCQLLERTGRTVYTVKGSYENIKITTPEDIEIAEGILTKRGEI